MHLAKIAPDGRGCPATRKELLPLGKLASAAAITQVAGNVNLVHVRTTKPRGISAARLMV